MKKLSLLLFANIIATGFAFPQGTAINTTGATADSSALLDVSCTQAPFLGTLITRLTTVQRNSVNNPAEGLLIFNTTTKCFESFVGGAWNVVSCPITCIPPSQPDIISGTNPACQNISGVVYSVTDEPGVSYSWAYSGSGLTCVSGCNTNTVTVDFSPSASPGTLSCTPSNNCGAGSPQTLDITFNSAPTTAYAGPDQIDIPDTTTTLDGNTPLSGTGLWTIISGTGGNIVSPTSPTSEFTGNPGSTYVLEWTITNSPCAPSSDQVTISITDCPLGASLGGGIAFYSGGGKCYVVTSSDVSSGAQWGCFGTFIPGAAGSAIGTGPANTAAIVAACTTPGIAAYICDTLTLNGYTDWYLPSHDEFLQICYQMGGSLVQDRYWDSTDLSDCCARATYIPGCGTYSNAYKTDSKYVRCTRAF